MSEARDSLEEPGGERSGSGHDALDVPLGEIIDVSVLRTLVDGAFQLTGIPAAIVDLDGNVLLKSDWQEVCDRFHRGHPETRAACLQSDTFPARNAPSGTLCEHRCGNGLWDLSTPLFVGGRQVGNFFVGQFFYDDETVSPDVFRERARSYGFDEADYLAAVGKVPRWSRVRVEAAMRYYAKVAEVISAVATRTLEQARMLAEKERLVSSLAESEGRFEALFEHSPMSVWEEDFSGVKRELDALRAAGVEDVGRYLDGHAEVVARCASLVRVLRVNETTARAFGVASKHDVLTNLLAYFDDESLAVFRDELVALADGKTTFHCEIPIRPPGGSRRFLDLSLAVVPGFEETLERVIVTFVDTTEKRRAELALRESEERLRIAADASDLGTWQHDLATGRVHADRRSREHFQVEKADPSFDDFLERVHPEDHRRVLDEFRRALGPTDGDGRTSVEYRIVRPDGEVRWISVYVKVAFEGQGASRRPVSSAGTTQDVTARRKAEEAIRSSEAQYRHLVEHLQAGVVVHGPDSRIRFLNPQACVLLGLTRDEALGKVAVDPAWCFLAEDGRPLGVSEYPVSRVIATGRPIENVVLGIHDPRSGEDTWVAVTAFPETAGDGALKQVVVSFIDITAQRRAQAELSVVAKISGLFQQRLPMSAIHAAVAGILSSALRFPIVAVELFDRAAGEMVFAGTAGMPGVAPGRRVPIALTLSGLVATTGTGLSEVRASAREECRDESLRRLGVETFLCVPVSVSGEVVATIALADRVARRDASVWLRSLDAVARALAQELGRRRAEDALRESEERLRLAADAAELGIWFNDLQTGRVRGDERARTQFGLEALEVPFEEVLARVHPDDVPILVGAVGQAARGGDESARGSLEYRIVRPDGAIRWLSVFVRLLLGGEGAERRVLGIVGTSQDITLRKRTEETQLRTQKLEALGTLAGGVAHDFNNILMAIRGNAALAAEELPDGHPVRELVGEIDRAGLRAVALVRQILAFARPVESARAVVPLGPVVDEALRLLRATLPAQIAIRTTWHEDLPRVAVDAGQVHQAVVNLVTNAAHAIGRRPGRIDLELFAREVGEETGTLAPGIGTGPHVCLSVRDDGCGMDRATLARVFDPFFTTKQTGEGTGLGLSIVHGIMRSHAGAVDVRSKPGRGTTVSLYFPAVEAPAEPAPAVRPKAGGRRTERILVVDDDEAIAILSRRSLGRLGYAVTTFTDPAEAVAAFTRAPDAWDAVVTDISMPGMTGFDVAGALLSARPGLALVITSGYIRPEDEAAALRLGVKALIAKPDTVDELAGVLDRVFRGEPT